MWRKVGQIFKAVGRLLSGRRVVSTGVRGEQRAAEYLQRERGVRIVARNWRNPRDRRDEIDLVARDGEVLVFVEVKTRALGALVTGYHAVNQRKLQVLRRAMKAYLNGLGAKPVTVRLDVVEVALPAEGSTDRVEIRYFANIPLGHGQPRL